jgi:hypothetical protein
MARDPRNTAGDDVAYLEMLASQIKEPVHRARVEDIAYKLKALESVALQGWLSYLRELEKRANGR